MSDLRKLLRAEPGGTRLADIDPRSTPGLPGRRVVGDDRKGWSATEVAAASEALGGYQERLFASAKEGATRQRVLLVLQAMDCGGKDGTVRNVTQGMSPAGMKAVGFGPPTAEERRHDFLWRIARALPAPGYVGVFNRSHYEDVLVARVHNLVSEDVWSGRYEQINAFEAEQAADGLTMVKVMLHISRDEQKKRLLARLDDPGKHWKYNPGDLAERARWDDYQQAYEDALNRCSTDAAPWYVVPADRKWYRNWAVATLLRDTFADLDPQYPEPDFDVAAERAKLLAAG
ncbi:polyphosphate--nucleotide phosphotransferase [Amorphoplanes nipponensis]|uniref:Polyphosphate--nucleotide phosphotransferase n=1 Tax=Actinoplanes nipponensis TaxID=135950 RepID=A0A919JMA4_9ACTN|nr:PPK2 family polyphosphate kinase [Actinoplanes nipponensis]GIE53654.1 polyphosphate--nucleotide phosphotransferase [Actinoplanes nipponensis]